MEQISLGNTATGLLVVVKNQFKKKDRNLKQNKQYDQKRNKSKMADTEMIAQLLSDHKAILKQMKKIIDTAEDAGDEGTINSIGACIREIEKASWILNA